MGCEVAHLRSRCGLAKHQPEGWALANNCFRNVARKVAEDGGRAVCGWTFHHRLAEKIAGLPLYVYLTHHAVWARPDGRLINVTPYPDPRHEPIGTGGAPIFLVDPTAPPIVLGGQPAPLPMKFFAVDPGNELAEYVERLNREEKAKCDALYAMVAEAASPS